jgi:hypothetical protein
MAIAINLGQSLFAQLMEHLPIHEFASHLLVVRKRLHLEAKLSTVLQILSVSPFEKTPIHQVSSLDRGRPMETESHNLLRLLDF